MNAPESTSDAAPPVSPKVFVSYATADRKHALSVCKAIESRGPSCWIATRDVAPGENYQEAIVHAIRGAQAMVLVFTEVANNSDEIKKELSLASRYHVPVMALRIEDVEPGDAFSYELSTRQWIDAFEGWDSAIDSVVSRVGQLATAGPTSMGATPVIRRSALVTRRSMAIATAASLLVLVMAAGAWWLRPQPTAPHSMTVRLAGFRMLSAEFPASTSDAVDAEIAAAFNAEGVVGVSNATAAAPGSAPAYALDGTIQNVGQTIRVITRLTNERSGATLWSGTFNYDGNEASKLPRHVAVDAGNVVRCGLFGASTYYKPLPDSVFRDYMQFCQGYWDPHLTESRKALLPAQRVVAAVPDFSWGWAAVAGAFWKMGATAETSRSVEEARASGLQAADRAIAIDERNSEALFLKAQLVDRRDWLARETLLKRAVGVRRLDCGCEHTSYGWMLANVGRTADALEQLHRANDMLALDLGTHFFLADVLVAAGKPEEAKQHYDAAIELAPDSGVAREIALWETTVTGDIEPLLDPKSPLSAALRAALLEGYRAVSLGNSGAKAKAVQTLLALPQDQQDDGVAMLLAKLGADHAAFQIAARSAPTEDDPGPSIFWYPGMRETLRDPGFPALADQIGLMKYWRSAHVRPDVCNEKAAPPFCRMI